MFLCAGLMVPAVWLVTHRGVVSEPPKPGFDPSAPSLVQRLLPGSGPLNTAGKLFPVSKGSSVVRTP